MEAPSSEWEGSSPRALHESGLLEYDESSWVRTDGMEQTRCPSASNLAALKAARRYSSRAAQVAGRKSSSSARAGGGDGEGGGSSPSPEENNGESSSSGGARRRRIDEQEEEEQKNLKVEGRRVAEEKRRTSDPPLHDGHLDGSGIESLDAGEYLSSGLKGKSKRGGGNADTRNERNRRSIRAGVSERSAFSARSSSSSRCSRGSRFSSPQKRGAHRHPSGSSSFSISARSTRTAASSTVSSASSALRKLTSDRGVRSFHSSLFVMFLLAMAASMAHSRRGSAAIGSALARASRDAAEAGHPSMIEERYERRDRTVMIPRVEALAGDSGGGIIDGSGDGKIGRTKHPPASQKRQAGYMEDGAAHTSAYFSPHFGAAMSVAARNPFDRRSARRHFQKLRGSYEADRADGPLAGASSVAERGGLLSLDQQSPMRGQQDALGRKAGMARASAAAAATSSPAAGVRAARGASSSLVAAAAGRGGGPTGASAVSSVNAVGAGTAVSFEDRTERRRQKMQRMTGLGAREGHVGSAGGGRMSIHVGTVTGVVGKRHGTILADDGGDGAKDVLKREPAKEREDDQDEEKDDRDEDLDDNRSGDDKEKAKDSADDIKKDNDDASGAGGAKSEHAIGFPGLDKAGKENLG